MAPFMLPLLSDSDNDASPGIPVGGDHQFETSWRFADDGDPINGVKSEKDPIAIVGIGCRLPGEVKCASDLWNMLMDKRSGHSKVPASRWNIDAFYHPNGADKIGSMSMDSGYFIDEDLREFENSFFGINNVEATFMDPQQRKLLEVVYECLENAGIPLHQVNGANVGCFVGSFTLDYWMMQTREPDYLHRYHATGMGTTILANRISHALNLKGPSFTLDTGCSSSLYALHQACTALDIGECDAAIVAASNLLQSPEQQLGTMKAGVLSPTGTCHTFDTAADGYGRADGLAAIYLKKLSKAIADGDAVRTVIRGTAVNSNGKTQGISLPSTQGQEAVIRKAYANAGLGNFKDTDYVECHGTGTPVGDPIEVEAISRVFRRNTSQEGPLLIGSVKTNLGHSEACSGLSSIIKATLALEKGCIPATIGVKNINPKIKTEEWGVHIVTETTQWPASDRPIHRVGINSFGYGGANGHAVLDSAKGHVLATEGALSEELSLARSAFLIPLSASNSAALETQVARLLSANLDHVNVVDLAHTLGTRRSILAQRGFALVGQKTLKEDLNSDRFQTTAIGNFSKLPIAFVFTGQGAQWAQMGKELIEEIPSYRRSIQDLDAVLQTLPERPSWTLQQALLEPKETSQISHVTRSQPVCTAVQIALVQLLGRWGIKPQSVVGHSSGEICAAYTAGHLTAAQAIVVAYYRGYVVGKSRSMIPGAMLAASLSKNDAESEIERLGLTGGIRVACINSPESVTISGDASDIDAVLADLQSRGIFAKKLNTNGRAYHSHHMVPLGEEYQSLLERNLGSLHTPDEPSDVAWLSSVYGEPITSKILPAYWRKNLESPVLFSGALSRLAKGSKLHFVEIGPHSALELPIKQICKKLNISDANYHYSSALTRGKNGFHCVLSLMGNLFLHGHEIFLEKVNHVETSPPVTKQGTLLTDLPPYPWTYEQILFNESRSSHELRQRKYGHHDLLGLQVLGSNGVVTIWRNTLRVRDIPWVESHKLGRDIVFPAAGYIAMAIEAISQLTSKTKVDASSFTLRHVNIVKALPLPADENDQGVEVFTTMSPTKLSGTTNSAKWFDFEVTSFENGKSTVHATGMISVQVDTEVFAAGLPPEKIEFTELATHDWYEQFVQVGLNFGPAFQSMQKIEIDQKRRLMRARSTVEYLDGGLFAGLTQSTYIMHPITIDSMLQTALVASSAGIISNLACMVPTVIEHARLTAPINRDGVSSWLVDATSEPTGPGSIQISSELHDGQGQVCGQLTNVSAVAFQGAKEEVFSIDSIEHRHPMMRVLWKPDITKLTQKNAQKFSDFLTTGAAAPSESRVLGKLRKIAEMVGIVAHKKPRLKILELGSPTPEFSKYLLRNILHFDTAHKRCASYSRGFFSEKRELFVEDIEAVASVGDTFDNVQPQVGNKYDLIVFPNSLTTEEYTSDRLGYVKSLLNPNGAVLGFLPSHLQLLDTESSAGLATVQLPESDSSERVIYGKWSETEQMQSEFGRHHFVVVERGDDNSLNDVLVPKLCERFGQDVERLSLSSLTPSHITPKTTIICTVELYDPILATMSVSEMNSIKIITDNAAHLLWVTGGGQMDALRPNLAMASGFQRSLILEQPSLRFFTFDIDNPVADHETSVDNILATLEDIHSDDIPDCETIQKGGISYISRFVPEDEMNKVFRQNHGDKAILKRLDQATPCRLTIQSLGNFDTLAFKQSAPDSATLDAGFVEVDVKTIGLNAKDIFIYSGKVSTRGATSSLECAGAVTRIGSGVLHLKPGDRVVVMAPGHFATRESFPEWACEKLKDDEEYSVVSTLPLVFATALYGLCDRARIREQETVLIHSGAGGVGIAAIQIAQLMGAEVFTTVSTEEKRDFLVNTFGIRRENIFNSRDSSFLPGILAATNGKGVDIVLNSLTGDLLHDSWRACARFGRFVEIGKRDLIDAGKLDMQRFRDNVTFTAFDLSELYDLTDRGLSSIWERLLRELMSLYRERKIKPFSPLRVFDASEVSQAFRYFSSKNRMGKIAISFENGESVVPVLPLRFEERFPADKTYLLSGCLGGIGRSISRWMLKQGARKFVFIGRSGLDKEPARQLVKELEDSGASVKVVRGDVSIYEDVKSCVDAIEGHIGGVIQAAMSLDESIFTTMSHQSWHTSVGPKVQGSWNLHNAIKGKDSELDFFLMTSSVAGSVGTATESNYTSANSFMDNFAKYRRRNGLPATSIGLGMISEVGYLHENPEIEAILLRKGIQPIKQEELLSIFDISLARPSRLAMEEAHVLTGLETQGMKKLRQKGFEGTIPTLNDPRASILASSLDGESDLHSKKTEAGLPPALAECLEAGGDDEAVLDIITDIIVHRLSNLILVQVEKIDRNEPLTKWGMDSMLAAEFRTWFFMAFSVDIPFLLLLGDVTPQILGEMTKKDMMAAGRFTIG
ncbi:MAG: Type I Iterative PKS [Peltula sp. TS41687]|nr:MAG: Type I Iterative PKS [Peltula sp. TS41687]